MTRFWIITGCAQLPKPKAVFPAAAWLTKPANSVTVRGHIRAVDFVYSITQSSGGTRSPLTWVMRL